MARITPFRAVRPVADKVHLVASRSYVSYNPAALKRKLDENPFTFIHIINPEFGQEKKAKPNSTERFVKVRERYNAFCREGIFMQDENPAFYIYRQENGERSFTGIICGISIDEYRYGNIKIHEHTLTERENTFCKYLDTCNFNAEPVLLTYRENAAEVQTLISARMSERPLYDFSTTDRHRHQLWSIGNAEEVQKIQKAFDLIPHVYIADGHHRMASSALLGEERRKQNSGGEGMYNFALAMLMPAEMLDIKPFHRLVNLGASFNEVSFLAQLKKGFVVTRQSDSLLPDEKRYWGMRLASGWYGLRLKEPDFAHSKSEQLDAMILTRKILQPILGIEDQKTDKRIQFIPGNESIVAHERAIDKGAASVLFTLSKVDADELFDVADAGEVMPPKSTWIAPKLRSGLTVMSLD